MDAFFSLAGVGASPVVALGISPSRRGAAHMRNACLRPDPGMPAARRPTQDDCSAATANSSTSGRGVRRARAPRRRHREGRAGARMAVAGGGAAGCGVGRHVRAGPARRHEPPTDVDGRLRRRAMIGADCRRPRGHSLGVPYLQLAGGALPRALAHKRKPATPRAFFFVIEQRFDLAAPAARVRLGQRQRPVAPEAGEHLDSLHELPAKQSAHHHLQAHERRVRERQHHADGCFAVERRESRTSQGRLRCGKERAPQASGLRRTGGCCEDPGGARTALAGRAGPAGTAHRGVTART